MPDVSLLAILVSAIVVFVGGDWLAKLLVVGVIVSVWVVRDAHDGSKSRRAALRCSRGRIVRARSVDDCSRSGSRGGRGRAEAARRTARDPRAGDKGRSGASAGRIPRRSASARRGGSGLGGQGAADPARALRVCHRPLRRRPSQAAFSQGPSWPPRPGPLPRPTPLPRATARRVPAARWSRRSAPARRARRGCARCRRWPRPRRSGAPSYPDRD